MPRIAIYQSIRTLPACVLLCAPPRNAFIFPHRARTCSSAAKDAWQPFTISTCYTASTSAGTDPSCASPGILVRGWFSSGNNSKSRRHVLFVVQRVLLSQRRRRAGGRASGRGATRQGRPRGGGGDNQIDQ